MAVRLEDIPDGSHIAVAIRARILGGADGEPYILGDAPASFGDVALSVRRWLTLFANKGFTPGQRLALSDTECAGFMPAYLAAVVCGLTAVPLDRSMPEQAMARMLQRVRPVGLMTAGADTGLARAAELSGVEPILLTRLDAMAEAPGDLPRVFPAPTDIADISFTSGTASEPKGVMLDGGTFLQIVRRQARVYGVVPGDVLWSLFPATHSSAVLRAGPLLCYLAGASFLPTRRSPSGLFATGMAEVAQYAPTHISGLPPLLRALVWQSEDGDHAGGRVRYASTGGAPLDGATRAGAAKLFGCEVTDVLSSTECGLLSDSGRGLGDAARGTVGRPVDARVQVVDAHLDPVPRGTVGRIVAHRSAVFQGYMDDPAATAAAFEDDWFVTGDLGRIDDDGLLRVVARADAVINVGGTKVAPNEVEAAIRAAVQVRDVAVVGVPDPIGGERVVACVVPLAGHDVSEAAIHAACSERLRPAARPRIVLLMDRIPLTGSGKPRLTAIRELLETG